MSKVTMPEPFGWLLDCPPGGGLAFQRERPSEMQSLVNSTVAVFTTTQAEAYAAAKVRESHQWQPIETAPKDGTMILLGRKEDKGQDLDSVSIPGFWQEGWEDSVDDMGCDSGFVDINFQVFDGGRSFGSEKYRCSPVQPTHWMPLPDPPSDSRPGQP